MKYISLMLLFVALGLLCSNKAIGQIVVNPDGTHSVVSGNVIVNPNGTHSIVTGNVVVNPNGTHSVIHGNILVGPNGSHSVMHGNVLVAPNGNHKIIPTQGTTQLANQTDLCDSLKKAEFNIEYWLIGLFDLAGTSIEEIQSKMNE